MTDIVDFISGKSVPDSQEERVVQLLSKWLFRIGYSRDQIQTHPQWCVRQGKKSLWADIAVFADPGKEQPPTIICECKAPGTTSGLDQLRKYVRLSGARLGIWFNGDDLAFVFDIPKASELVRNDRETGDQSIAFGRYVRTSRERLAKSDPKFSLRKLAKRVGVSPAYLSLMERGEASMPGEEVLLKLASELVEDEREFFARAGKLHPKFRDAVIARPHVLGSLIRAAEDMPDELVEKLIERAREVKDGDW